MLQLLFCAITAVVQHCARPPGSASHPVPPQRPQLGGQHAPIALALAPGLAQPSKDIDCAIAVARTCKAAERIMRVCHLLWCSRHFYSGTSIMHQRKGNNLDVATLEPRRRLMMTAHGFVTPPRACARNARCARPHSQKSFRNHNARAAFGSSSSYVALLRCSSRRPGASYLPTRTCLAPRCCRSYLPTLALTYILYIRIDS